MSCWIQRKADVRSSVERRHEDTNHRPSRYWNHNLCSHLKIIWRRKIKHSTMRTHHHKIVFVLFAESTSKVDGLGVLKVELIHNECIGWFIELLIDWLRLVGWRDRFLLVVLLWDSGWQNQRTEVFSTAFFGYDWWFGCSDLTLRLVGGVAFIMSGRRPWQFC